MAVNEVAGMPSLHMRATEPCILGGQGVELTLQDDDAVTERCQASIHGELPGWRKAFRAVDAAPSCVFRMTVNSRSCSLIGGGHCR